MAFDLRIVTPVKSGDPEEVGPRDGILLPQLVSSCAARLVEGTEKLVQQIALEILNDPLPDGTGSGLSSALKSAPPTEGEARRIAQSGVKRVRSNILAQQQRFSDGLDESELLADLRLLSFSISGTSFDLRLEVVTVGGNVTIELVEVPA